MGQQQSPTGSCLGRPEPAVRARVCTQRPRPRGEARSYQAGQQGTGHRCLVGLHRPGRLPEVAPGRVQAFPQADVRVCLGLGVAGDLRSWKMSQDGGMEEGLPRAG